MAAAIARLLSSLVASTSGRAGGCLPGVAALGQGLTAVSRLSKAPCSSLATSEDDSEWESDEDSRFEAETGTLDESEPANSVPRQRTKVPIPPPISEESFDAICHAVTYETWRRHNSSLPRLEGQVIVGRVVRAEKRYLHIDTGFKGLAKVNRKHLHSSQLVASADAAIRTSQQDFRIGDVLKFVLEDIETPFGDMLLDPDRPKEDEKYGQVWNELQMAMQMRRPVNGRVLNPIKGGYAVGLAGVVGFLPDRDSTILAVSRVGVLQPFHVTSMNASTRNVVLCDPSRFAARLQATNMRQRY